MRIATLAATLALGLLVPAFAADEPDWHANISIIEACSCPMFCQCFFSTAPASHPTAEGHEGHGGAHTYCKFNNAYQINAGHFGDVDLAGAKFWAAGDLGDDFSDGELEWVHVTFDTNTTEAQRAAIGTVMGSLYPMSWKTMTTGVGVIDWVPGTEEAYATIDGGVAGEVRLRRNPTASGEGPTMISGLTYFGEDTNEGFILMPNILEAWRGSGGVENFEFRGSNGFMITVDISSKEPMAMDDAPHGGMGG